LLSPETTTVKTIRFRTRLAQGQQGVMLIEALVGILIFAVGIIALMGLQSAAITNTIEAKFRSDAAFFANQIIGKMWVDRANVVNLSYDTTNAGASGNAELQAWKTAVQNTLPQATGALSPTVRIVNSNAGYDVTVTVFWQKPGQADSHKFMTVARLDYNP
jgi:type IV pilus assembly protein PilV